MTSRCNDDNPAIRLYLTQQNGVKQPLCMWQNESELERFFQFPTPLYCHFNQQSAWATSTLYIIAFLLLFTRLHREHVQASMYVVICGFKSLGKCAEAISTSLSRVI